jgi:hypothetical protein
MDKVATTPEGAFRVEEVLPESYEMNLTDYNNRIWDAYTAQTPLEWEDAIESYDLGYSEGVFKDQPEAEAHLVNKLSGLSDTMHEAEWDQGRDMWPSTMDKRQAQDHRQSSLYWKKVADGKKGEGEVPKVENEIPPFMRRVNNPENYPYITNQDGSSTTHLMSAEEDADGNWFVFPTVVLKEDGTLHHFKNNREAMAYNMKRDNYKTFGKDKQGAFDYSAGGYKTDKFRNFYKELEEKRLKKITSSPENRKDNEDIDNVVYKDQKRAENEKGVKAFFHDSRKVKDPKKPAKKLKPKKKKDKPKGDKSS